VRTRLPVAIGLVAALAVACSSGSDAKTAPDAKDTTTTRAPATATRPPGPAARISGPITGGNAMFLASASTTHAVPTSGWVEAEYAASGTATSYTSAGPLPTDGHFRLTEGPTAQYRTRIVVRRPRRPAAFNGTVVVEWLNVSGGLDAAPDYTYMRSEIVRRGYAWVGVSAQLIGIEGGAVAVSVPQAEAAGAGKGIKHIDPARYGDLVHPGDAFSYDIYTQVARAMRAPQGVDALGPLTAQRVLAVGESQSAFALTTYVDGVQPLTHEFDGFVIHSRGGAAAPLGEPGKGIDIAGSISGAPTKIRTDAAAPIIVVQTETDILGLLGAYPARQRDSARFRWWEVAGTAHADKFQVGPVADGLGCPAPVNDGPDRFVVRTALHDLDRWVRTGAAPPKAPRFAIDTAAHAYVRDEWGNVKGGIRTPLVDVPVDTLSGESAGGSVVCILFGFTKPLTAEQLGTRYQSRADYRREYRAAVQRAIASGFVLADDRPDLLAMAQPDRIPG
jgi:Alpha/beta hydrolase domain